jgi:MFS family permease
MQGTMVAWMVYQISHSPIDLGLIGLAEIIPFVAILLFGGAWSDKYNRKRLMISSVFAYFLVSLCLLILAFEVQNGHAIELYPVYSLIFIAGLARGILSPSQNALMGQMVASNDLNKASVFNSMVFQIGSVGGPAIGGICYAYFGVGNSFFAVTILLGLALLILMGLPVFPNPENKNVTETIFQRISVGIQFVRNHKVLLPGMVMDMVAVLFGGAVAVLPLFADQILHTGPEGLGWLRAAPAIGSLLIASVLVRFPLGKNAGKWLLICVFCFGICNFIFAISTSFWISFSMLLIGGGFDNVSAIIRMTLVQIYTPDEMKGRVSAVNSIFIGSSNELGAFESGVAARLLGLVPSVVFGAIVTFATVGLTAWKAPKLRNLDLSNPQK